MPPKKKTTADETKAAAPAAEKPKPKKVAGRKSDRADEADAAPSAEKPAAKKSPAAKPAAKKSADPAPAAEEAPTKKLRRESSTGGECALMPATKDLESLSQEEVEKGTVAFDYADCLSKNNSTVFPPSSHYKIITWNVAGLRSLAKPYAKSELKTLIDEEAPDVLCLQETKLSDPAEAARVAVIDGYTFVESLSTAKLGYSGTRTYLRNGLFDAAKSRHHLDFNRDLASVDSEGRVVASFLVPAEAGAAPLTIVNNYVPNSGLKLERLDFRVADYDVLLRGFLEKDVPALEKTVYGSAATPAIVWLGDLNVAERNFDRFHNGNYKKMQCSQGFTPPERASFRKTIAAAGLVDSFRHFYPTHRGAYTYYSRMFNQRANGKGWRLDYFAVSSALISGGRVVGTAILDRFKASDHVPSVLYVRKH